MSTSLLYHALGIRGYRYVRTDYFSGAVVFTIEQPRANLQCPVCSSRNVIAHGQVPRLFRTVPIGSKSIQVLLKIPRVECHSCGVTRQVTLPFADPQKHYTHVFERYVLQLAERMTIQDVARHLGISWDTVKDIQKRHLQKHFTKPQLRQLKRI